MSGVATAIIGGAVVGGYVQDRASGRAVDAQRDATNASLSAQERMYEQQRTDQEPWRQAGETALGSLMGQMGMGSVSGDGQGLDSGVGDKFRANSGGTPGSGDLMRGFTMDDFESDPGYQFRLDEGNRAIERSAAARGGLNSGGTMQALMGYGQNMASQEYGNAYNRYNQDQSNQYNRLASIAGLGQTSVGQLGQASQNYGNAMSGALTGMGNANAAASIAQGNSTANLIGSGMNAAAMYYGRNNKAGGQGGGALFSDVRLKKNVTPISSVELDEFRSSIKPYFYEYIKEEHGDGKWFGVMAQDLEKSKLGKTIVFEDKDGNKQIHFKKLVSLMLATMAKGAA